MPTMLADNCIGKYLKIGDDHVVGVGKGGRECHFTIKGISPGVVVLSTSTGTLGTGRWLHLWQRALTHACSKV